jgi:hypothetical protein
MFCHNTYFLNRGNNVIWNDRDWEQEDKTYAPKRRVDNKISWQMPHIIGSFHSNKMNRVVEYHSMNEYLFYFILELDTSVIRYYVQPINILVPFMDKQGNKKTWSHVPDVLVFRNGFVPLLYQIKEKEAVTTATYEKCNVLCRKYAMDQGWHYSVTYPKVLPKVIQTNIKFLEGFIKKRKNADLWIPELVRRINQLGKSSIVDLAYDFSLRIDPLFILPIIYHLIATGVFSISLHERITEYSEVTNIPFINQFSNILIEERVTNETSTIES